MIWPAEVLEVDNFTHFVGNRVFDLDLSANKSLHKQFRLETSYLHLVKGVLLVHFSRPVLVALYFAMFFDTG